MNDVSAVIAAAHRAYCRDTGCFDGDDISHPGLAQAIRLSNAEAVVSALEQLYAEPLSVLDISPVMLGTWQHHLAVWKAEVTRLQGDA